MRRLWLLVGITLLAAACSSSSPTNVGGSDDGGAGSGGQATGGSQSAHVCDPGETQACIGAGKCDGGQVCNDAGTRWSKCDCGDGAGGTNTGGTNNTGGAAVGGAAVGGSGGNHTGGTSGSGGKNSGGSGGEDTGGSGGGGSGGTAASGGASSGGTGASGGSGSTGGTDGTGGAGDTGGSGGSAVGCGTELGILDGYYDNGVMCGYAWTAEARSSSGGDIPGSSILPECGASSECFVGGTLCATGTLPALDAEQGLYPTILIGWNLAQMSDSATIGTYTVSGTGLTVNYTAMGATGEVRVAVWSGATEYCAPAISGTAIPWTAFKTQCWGTSGTVLPAGAAISKLALLITEDDEAQTITQFCLDSVVNN